MQFAQNASLIVRYTISHSVSELCLCVVKGFGAAVGRYRACKGHSLAGYRGPTEVVLRVPNLGVCNPDKCEDE